MTKISTKKLQDNFFYLNSSPIYGKLKNFSEMLQSKVIDHRNQSFLQFSGYKYISYFTTIYHIFL